VARSAKRGPTRRTAAAEGRQRRRVAAEGAQQPRRVVARAHDLCTDEGALSFATATCVVDGEVKN
jgi:hypothetical protein